MTGWMAATAATAMLGAAAISPLAQGRTPQGAQSDGGMAWAFPEEQAVRVFAGSGSQIGVTIRDFTEEDLKGKAAGTGGVVIERVEDDSPAAKAGLKSGDVVVEFDGERVRSTRQFVRLVQETPLGRPIQAAVMRDGQRVTLSVQPREGRGFRYKEMDDWMARPPKPPVPPPPPGRLDVLPRIEGMFGTARLGVTVEELSPQLAEYFGTKDGVLVKSVDDNSVGSKTGLKAGDVITALDGGNVSTAADLRRRAQRLEAGDEFTLSIVRDKKATSLKGKFDQPQSKRSTRRTIL